MGVILREGGGSRRTMKKASDESFLTVDDAEYTENRLLVYNTTH